MDNCVRLMRILSSIVLLTVSLNLYSQSVLTIQEAIGTAVKNNYDILLVKNDAQASALDYSYAYAAFLPQLNGTAGKVWNDHKQKQNFLDGRKRSANGRGAAQLPAARVDIVRWIEDVCHTQPL